MSVHVMLFNPLYGFLGQCMCDYSASEGMYAHMYSTSLHFKISQVMGQKTFSRNKRTKLYILLFCNFKGGQDSIK